MYDYVRFSMPCPNPNCDAILDGFQTKDTDCTLDIVSIQEVYEFYTMCDACGSWIEFIRPEEMLLNTMVPSDDPIKLGFKMLVTLR